MSLVIFVKALKAQYPLVPEKVYQQIILPNSCPVFTPSDYLSIPAVTIPVFVEFLSLHLDLICGGGWTVRASPLEFLGLWVL